MKRYVVLFAVLSAFVLGGIALAQSTTLPPQAEQEVRELLKELQQREGAGSPNADRLRAAESALQSAQRGGPIIQTPFGPIQNLRGGRGAAPAANKGAWWTNAALVE